MILNSQVKALEHVRQRFHSKIEVLMVLKHQPGFQVKYYTCFIKAAAAEVV